jgi:hypothetical protein
MRAHGALRRRAVKDFRRRIMGIGDWAFGKLRRRRQDDDGGLIRCEWESTEMSGRRQRDAVGWGTEGEWVCGLLVPLWVVGYGREPRR